MNNQWPHLEYDNRPVVFDGEFNIANRGIIEFIEVLKLDVAFLYDLLGASQEHKVKPKKFAQTDIDSAIHLLERVGLVHMLDKRADELSGGQRQRVGIARALIQEPELLLVDEPTASLDPKTSRQIMRLICELCEERKLAAIINIHDVMLAQMFAQRIVGLQHGAIVYDGPPDGLDPDVLTQIYGEEDWSATIQRGTEENQSDTHGGPPGDLVSGL